MSDKFKLNPCRICKSENIGNFHDLDDKSSTKNCFVIQCIYCGLNNSYCLRDREPFQILINHWNNINPKLSILRFLINFFKNTLRKR